MHVVEQHPLIPESPASRRCAAHAASLRLGTKRRQAAPSQRSISGGSGAAAPAPVRRGRPWRRPRRVAVAGEQQHRAVRRHHDRRAGDRLPVEQVGQQQPRRVVRVVELRQEYPVRQRGTASTMRPAGCRSRCRRLRRTRRPIGRASRSAGARCWPPSYAMPISMFSHSGRNASSVMPNCPAVCSAVTQRSVALRITGAASRARRRNPSGSRAASSRSPGASARCPARTASRPRSRGTGCAG